MKSQRVSVSSWIILYLLCLVMGVTLLLLSGCGGRSSGQTISIAISTGRAQLTVHWPKGSRLIPFAANSIDVRIVQGNSLLGETLLVRPTNGGNATASFDRLPTGAAVVEAWAYPQADGSGVAQAQGQVGVTIVGGQTASVSLTMDSTIDHLEITPATPSTLNIGSTVQLMVTAKDASGAVVITSTSTIAWASADGTIATVDATGLVKAIGSGSTTIKVSETESGKTATLLVNVAPSSNADLIAYEGFAYPVDSNLAGQAGGVGLVSTPWDENNAQGSSPTKIVSGSLTFKNLVTSGNAAESTSDLPFGAGRGVINASALGATGTVIYESILIEPLDPLNAGSPDTYFGFGTGNLFAGKAGANSNWALQTLGGSGTVATNIPVVQNQTAFLVIRQTFGGSTDKVELWVNPTPGQPLPTPDAVKTDLKIQGIGVAIGGSIRCIFDEYRIGRTWESVSPTQ
jgi:hypothetical protein